MELTEQAHEPHPSIVCWEFLLLINNILHSLFLVLLLRIHTFLRPRGLYRYFLPLFPISSATIVFFYSPFSKQIETKTYTKTKEGLYRAGTPGTSEPTKIYCPQLTANSEGRSGVVQVTSRLCLLHKRLFSDVGSRDKQTMTTISTMDGNGRSISGSRSESNTLERQDTILTIGKLKLRGKDDDLPQ